MAAIKKSGLGRGLESVFTDNSMKSDSSPVTLRLSQVQPRKGQPRKVFDDEGLDELSQSIKEHGLIQPITVRSVANGFYEIIAGERRYRACKMAGLTEIPVIVMELDDRKTALVSLIENIQRENLGPMEIAKSLQKLADEYSLTQEQIADTLGKSRSSVANYLRLVNLPSKTASALTSGSITLGHAKLLAALGADADKIIDDITSKSLNVRQTEELIDKFKNPKPVRYPKDPLEIDYKAHLEERVMHTLGRRTKIEGRGKSKRLELYFEDENDLEELLTKLCGEDFFNE